MTLLDTPPPQKGDRGEFAKFRPCLLKIYRDESSISVLVDQGQPLIPAIGYVARFALRAIAYLAQETYLTLADHVPVELSRDTPADMQALRPEGVQTEVLRLFEPVLG